MDQRPDNTLFNLDRKLARRKFFAKSSLFAGAAAFSLTGGSFALASTRALVFSSVNHTVPLYRLRHNGNTDHFYTTNAKERDDAVKKAGYVYEGIQCYVFSSQVSDSVPFYRLRHNGSDIDHFYTASASERDAAVKKFGYTYEGIQCYVLASGNVPLYRLNHSGDADHFYTTDPAELNSAIKKNGYTYEGVAGYVLLHS